MKHAVSHVRLLAALVLGAAVLLSGCDNPACIFGGSCEDDDGSSGAAPNPASAPANHAWIVAGAPRVTSFFPAGTSISTEAPIIVVFNESLASASIQSAFTLQITGAGQSFPVPTAAPTLVGDGRVLVVAPLTALTASTTYALKVADTATVTDLQGFALTLATDRVIGTFTTAATNPAVPRVITSFPPDGATGQSTTSEFVVVFDRKMNSGTFNVDSFAVEVNGATPAENPLPQPVLLFGTTGIPTSDTRVWVYRSEDSDGEAVPLATSANVVLTLSPSGDQLTAVGGGVLATTVLDYRTAAFGSPTSAEITSVPDDAIGIDNLNGTTPLAIGLQLVGAQANDSLDIYTFGASTEPQSRTISLSRSVRLGDIASFDVGLQTVTVGEGHVDLATGASPVEGRFADGSIAVAFALRRSGTTSAVRLLDVDQVENGVQQARFDVTRPVLSAFGTSGSNTSTFRSTARDLVVVGDANEELRAVEVVAGAQNNGALAEVVASNGAGLFIAQPVALGVVDPATLPLDFTVTLYDRALNRSLSTYDGEFTQLGTLADSSAVNPGFVQVEVFDSRTLAALANARVFVHEEIAGALASVDSDTTTSTGIVTLVAGSVGLPVITVEATGYDLFTWYGATAERISVALERSSLQPGVVQGTVSTSSTDLPQFDRFAADTRVLATDEAQITVQSCTFNPQTLDSQCGFGPRPLRLGPLGAVGFVAVDPPASAFTFNAQSFLRGYALALPFAPVAAGGTSQVGFTVDELLDDPGTPAEELAIEGPAALLDASAATGVDLTQLDGDPRVSIQGRAPGFDAAVLAGFGAALDPQGVPASVWAVRSAFPGVVDPFDDDGAGTNDELGELVKDGTLAPELYLRCEVRDDLGARSVSRVRFDQVPAPGSVVLPAVPQITSPAAGSTTAGGAYDVDFDDVIADGSGLGGLYRVTLVASNGRRWTLNRIDPTGVATANVELPDLAAVGGSGLADGSILASVSAYGWAAFSANPLALADAELEHELLATSAAITFTQQ